MSDWVAVSGTLAGTLLGAGATFLTQRLQYKLHARDEIRDTRRIVYAEFLGSMHALYLEIRAARSEVKAGSTGDRDADAMRFERSLRAIQPLDSQVGLDKVRLVAPGETSECARLLFTHLRTVGGNVSRGSAWRDFSENYRKLRYDFIARARADLTA